MADINVYGTLKTMAEDQKVAYAKQVFDEDLNKDQHTINLELEQVKEDVVRTGYLIASWEDDKILTSTTYAVGSTIGEWGNGVRYGCRGVRLDVKEGDKVLLDTYSPALFGLIFTDENRVVKALYDDRRFDGVWTAPCDGYCYIQDVLYRENYHYASAHGHLAYMAHDARKRVAKGGDWYNEYAPRLQRECMPFVVDMTATANPNHFYPVKDGNGNYALTTWGAGEWHLFLAKVVFLDGQEGNITNIRLRYRQTDTYTLNNSGINNITADSKGKIFFPYAINRQASTAIGVFHTFMSNSMELNTRHNFRVDYIFTHSSSDFAELYQLAQKIINGEVEVDNFYGVKEKEVDFVRNAIGLQSISDLGYNILEHGATLPIDEEGYKYAKEIYEKYKDEPIKDFRYLFKNDQKLVYLPMLHFTNDTNSSLYQTFAGCNNLICVPPMKIPATTNGYKQIYTLFDNCFSLKRFDWDLSEYGPNALTASWRGCHSLEYIGELPDSVTQYSTQWISGCESLERIERMPLINILNSADFAWSFNLPNLRYVKMVDFGRITDKPSFNCYYWWPSWGIPNDKQPDARQSLVDSLLTYSYDRVNDPDNLGTADTTFTISLSVNSYAQLTASEIEAITAKGYTLTHP